MFPIEKYAAMKARNRVQLSKRGSAFVATVNRVDPDTGLSSENLSMPIELAELITVRNMHLSMASQAQTLIDDLNAL